MVEHVGTLQLVRQAVATASLYAATARHVVPRGGFSFTARLGRVDDRLVFVVGSPRSGTTMLAQSIGAVPGFVDLGEVAPLKAAVPELVRLPVEQAARQLRRVVERVRRLAAVRGLRCVEQTPEAAYLVDAIARAYPRARVVHIVRDGRDVVCSLLERGWLSFDRDGRDDVGQPYGADARFWVEPERRTEFESASNATRAAWAWRRYVGAARQHADHLLELRYEEVVRDPVCTAQRLAAHLEADPDRLTAALARAHERSVGRWRRDLSPEQLADVEREAGALLRELGYAS